MCALILKNGNKSGAKEALSRFIPRISRISFAKHTKNSLKIMINFSRGLPHDEEAFYESKVFILYYYIWYWTIEWTVGDKEIYDGIWTGINICVTVSLKIGLIGPKRKFRNTLSTFQKRTINSGSNSRQSILKAG